MVRSNDKNGIILAIILNFAVFVSFFIFNYTSYGAILMYSLAVLAFLISAAYNGFLIKVEWHTYYTFIVTLAIFCLLSSVWAWDISDSIGKALTIAKIFSIIFLMVCAYQGIKDVKQLLLSVMYGGVLVTVYAFFSYGIATMRLVLESSGRLDNDFANVNTMGTIAALAVVIGFYLFMTKKIKWSIIMTLPCIILVALTASRKAIVVLALGLLMTGLFYKKDKQLLTKVLRILLVIVIAIFVYELVKDMDIFKGVNSRIESLLQLYRGTGNGDRSARARSLMIKLGMEQFKKTPILGIGMGGGHLVNYRDAYLHNNYVEILVGGGIVGFLVYYSVYAYILITYLKCWRFRTDYSRLCVILVLLLLILDYGSVTYAEKQTFYYLLIPFLDIEFVKKNMQGGLCSEY